MPRVDTGLRNAAGGPGEEENKVYRFSRLTSDGTGGIVGRCRPIAVLALCSLLMIGQGGPAAATPDVSRAVVFQQDSRSGTRIVIAHGESQDVVDIAGRPRPFCWAGPLLVCPLGPDLTRPGTVVDCLLHLLSCYRIRLTHF